MLEEKRKWIEEFFAKCENKIYSVMDDIKIDYPMDIRGNTTKYEETEHTPFNWTSGFWGGIMWLLYLQTGKNKYKNRAVRCSERMQEMFYDNENFYALDNHDLGFVIGLTSVAHYRLTGDEDAKIRGLHAATILAGRYNPNGNFLRAWSVNSAMGEDVSGYAIIDSMLNLPLLYWASEETGDPRFEVIATNHADTVLNEFIKSDGSVYHIVDFDSKTGKVKGYPRGQGYESGSSWSRGQSWAVYGFTMSYLHTNNKKYLDAAKRVADYIIANMKDFKIPPVDYMQPKDVKIVDSSAGAATACGMIELSKVIDDGQKYEDFAISLLEGLFDDCDFSDKNQAILQSSRELYHNCVNFPIIYADYFLIEALMKLIEKTDFFMW